LGKEMEGGEIMGGKFKELKDGAEKMKVMYDKLKKEAEDGSMRLVRANHEILNLKTQGKDSTRKQHFAAGNIDQKNLRLTDEIKFLKKERRELKEKSDRVETESAEVKKQNFELLRCIEEMTGRKSLSIISEASEKNIEIPNNDTVSGYMTPVSCEEDLLEEIRRLNMKKAAGGLEVRSQYASGENGPNPGWSSSIIGWFGGKGSDSKPGQADGEQGLEQKIALLVNQKIQESLQECDIGGQLQDLRARETLYKKEIDQLRNQLQGGKGHRR
jgi:hypothetical protein